MVEKFYSEQSADIYCGHAIEVLRSLPAESVQMVITSPPYWGLRNYSGGSDIVWGGDNCEHEWGELLPAHHPGQVEQTKWKNAEAAGLGQTSPSGQWCLKCSAWCGQLGLEPTPELYVEHLMMIFREVKRVLKKSGSFYLNIGDTYNAARNGGWPGGKNQWKDDRYPNRSGVNVLDLQPKCMVCIPERVMFAMIDDGWILRNKNIWHKPNSMPSSVKDRFSTSWEYLYFFSKNNTTILWRNRETGEWRDTRPTKNENYPWGGMYQNPETLELSWQKQDGWLKLQPLWMGFDYYFDLDSVRIPHSTQSLERYQRGVNLDRPAIGKSAEVGPMQQYKRAPQWFQDQFSPDQDYKGKFDDLFGHGPNPQSFNLRVRDVKRGKGGATAQGGELKASDKEIEEYEYPEKHHGGSHHGRAGMENLTKHDQAVGRIGNVSYTDPLHIRDYSPKGKNPGDIVEIHREKEDGRYPKDHLSRPPEPEVDPARAFNAKGKNPGDYWELTTQPYKGAHFAVFPEKLCERPIKASSRVRDVVLDPFAGSGTTGVVAKRLGRRAILIDCVESYCAISKERISKVVYQPELGVE